MVRCQTFKRATGAESHVALHWPLNVDVCHWRLQCPNSVYVWLWTCRLQPELKGAVRGSDLHHEHQIHFLTPVIISSLGHLSRQAKVMLWGGAGREWEPFCRENSQFRDIYIVSFLLLWCSLHHCLPSTFSRGGGWGGGWSFDISVSMFGFRWAVGYLNCYTGHFYTKSQSLSTVPPYACLWVGENKFKVSNYRLCGTVKHVEELSRRLS